MIPIVGSKLTYIYRPGEPAKILPYALHIRKHPIQAPLSYRIVKRKND